MPTITISIDEDVKKVLDKRAKKNLLSLKEQAEDIIRRSTVNYKSGSSSSAKIDDRLVEVFSRHKKKRKK
ncbi:hypothetical protein A3K62_02370 [Candidatus Pacearchaeota archaeon RBG_16_35_8]|nr:MAG: hypothetical protein A3K62_02370 [Candidatus Pacearchaeota archaeon RBG_16_35_8]